MFKLQHTLGKKATFSGHALHTGNKVNIAFLPAPENHGIKFKRIDLADHPILDAHVDYVKQVERSTTLADGAIRIHTVEHAISALAGMGVDNAMIEMDSNEPPIADGSGMPFMKMVQEAGVVEQKASRKIFTLRDPIQIEGKGGSFIVAMPSDELRISCTNANHTGFFTQYRSDVITPEFYQKEIAPARTFCFYEEVSPLMDQGLIKGGSLENAVVIRGSQVLSKEALRFPDEFVRHKMLDIIGDLTLIGVPIKAHIIAMKPSHGLNVELAKALYKQYKKYFALSIPKESDLILEGSMDIQDVMKVLPHRPPFLMIDRVLKFDGETKAIGMKNVTMGEPYFAGHFPNYPIMPGVLQVEAMAQLASILMLKDPANLGKIGFFMSADSVKFRRPVFPGDTLIIEVEMTRSRGKIGKANGRCLVNKQVVSEAELMFSITDV